MSTAPTVVLEAVNRATFRACIDLKVADGQDAFVATNVYSLAQAWVEPTFYPVAVRSQDDGGEAATVVGFAMYGQDLESGQWWIVRFMIGADHQGRGYGRSAVGALMKLLVERHGASEVRLGCVVENDRARTLYESFGFCATGERDGSEEILLWRSAELGTD